MNDEAAPAFADLLRHYQAAAGLTQEELAAGSGLTPQGIGQLEREERRHPQAFTVVPAEKDICVVTGTMFNRITR